MNNDKMFEMFQKLEREIVDCLKKEFKGKIKESFLITRYSNIKRKTKGFTDLLKYYPKMFNLGYSNVMKGRDDIDFDIANHIVGVHTFNMLLISNEERGKKQNNQKYIDSLEETVIDQIKLRQYGSALFRKNKIFGNEDYLYYPSVYNLHVLVLYLYNLLINYNSNHNELSLKDDLYLNFIFNILNKCKGVIALVDYDNLDSAYAIMRGAIELYTVYLCLKYSKSDLNRYLKFNDFKIEYDTYFSFSDEFENEYKENGNQANKIDYLNYGWTDSIFEMQYLNKKNSYKFSDLTALVDLIINKHKKVKNYGNLLKEYYNKCHLFTHGNLLTFKYPIIYIMDLCKGIGEIVLGVAEEIKEYMEIPLYENIDIVKKTKESIDKLHSIRVSMLTEQLEDYYKNKH